MERLRLDEMLARVKEIGREEAIAIHQKAHWDQYRMTAAVRATPEKFMEYLKRRSSSRPQGQDRSMKVYLPRKYGFTLWWVRYLECLRLNRWPVG